MTLSLAAASSLEAEALGLIRGLRERGVDVDLGALSGQGHGPDAFAPLRDGGVDLVLARADSLPPLPEDVVMAAVPHRDEPGDVLVPAGSAPMTLGTLPTGARVGVAGPRRSAFLRAHVRGARVVPPGNGEGPVGALDSGSVDAVILSSTHVRRLGLGNRASEALDLRAWVPGPGQGTLVVLVRSEDTTAAEAAASLDDAQARLSLEAERATQRLLGASPATPLGVLAMPYSRGVRMWGMLADAAGTRIVRADVSVADNTAPVAAQTLVGLLLARGARDLLEATP